MTWKVSELQILGTAECAGTRKAQRLFKERRVLGLSPDLGER